MSVERWHQIKSIVVQALEAPAGERDAIVSAACGDDEELKREVDSLLAAAETADSIPEARAAIASAAGAIVAEQEAALRSALESVLGHQYEIIRELGRGGMSSVYLAKERALERLVAIKVLRPDLAMAENHRERFRREARIAARLSHPGILTLHSFGEVDNLWYFVMKYVRGETLAERIQREGALPWTDAHRIFLEVADALETAHKNGVIHRDIKPANILLDAETGHAMLADFGIAKMPGLTESLTAPGAVLGTPVFMSPEQLSGSPDIDERSDIYSLGSVAHLMLTGRPPSPANVAMPTVPAGLSAIVQKSIARERDDRWANTSALKAALESLVAADRMPDVVKDLRGFGPYALIWMLGFAGFASFGSHSPSERALLLVAAAIAPLGLALHLHNTARREMRLTDLARVASYPPSWWTMWWPRALRRPSDLWDRLPPIAKAVRIVISAAFPALFLLVLVREGISVPAMPESGVWVDAAEWALLAFASTVVIGGLVWARRAGLSIDQSLQLLLGATQSSSRWEDARVKRVLAPPSGMVRAPDTESPADYLRAIREASGLMPRPGGMKATETAQMLVNAIDQRDMELQKLSRDAGPDEEARLTSRLQSLESATEKSREAIELEELLRNELGLLHRIHGRRESILRDRARLFESLRELWSLVRETGEANDENSTATQRLDAFIAEVRAR